MLKASIFFIIISLHFHLLYSQFDCGTVYRDSRDGKSYPTIEIVGLCFMAKNMNIGKTVPLNHQSDNLIIEKTCYNSDSSMCDLYGGLYTYDEAMQYSSNKQGICPDSWHIATKDEYELLLGELSRNGNVSQQMKVDNKHQPKWDGNNSSGFSAIPGGLAYDNIFGRKGDWAVFWSATSANKDYAWSVELDNYYMTLSGYSDMKMTDTYLVNNGFSIRCVKDK